MFTHDVNIDVPFITALGVAYNHLGKMHEGVSRSWIQEEIFVNSFMVCLCHLVNTRLFSPWVDHRKVNAVTPIIITMLSMILKARCEFYENEGKQVVNKCCRKLT